MNSSHGSIIASCMTAMTLVVVIACGRDEESSSFPAPWSPPGFPLTRGPGLRGPSPKPDTETPSESNQTATTFFLADGETGTVKPPWSWQVADWAAGAPLATASTAHAKNGRWSYKYEIADPAYLVVNAHAVQTLSGTPQTSMGTPSGRYGSGYYSWWTYIDAGFTTPNNWNLWLGWMTGVSGAPSPISNLGLEVRNGQLQLVYPLKNCSGGLYTCPTIPGYTIDHGWYFMTPNSPAGRCALPPESVGPYFGLLQDGPDQRAGDHLAGRRINYGPDRPHDEHLRWVVHRAAEESSGDMILQFGIYGGRKPGPSGSTWMIFGSPISDSSPDLGLD